jgi:energy-coupling factor transporter ATP-binding protein EcfA2
VLPFGAVAPVLASPAAPDVGGVHFPVVRPHPDPVGRGERGVPLRIAGVTPKEREERVRLMLDIVGLGEHTKQRPGELSGGQQQRVAIARALAGSPQVLLADEPTGQLDSETGKQIMRLLHAVVESEGVTALVATHDPHLIGIADSVLELEDGKISGNLFRTVGGARVRPGVPLPHYQCPAAPATGVPLPPLPVSRCPRYQCPLPLHQCPAAPATR